MSETVNLTSPTRIRALLEARGLQTSQLLGQNFLIDANIRDIIVATAAVGPDDVVLEVGPGLGVITEPLTRLARRVIAVEKDAGFYAWLQESLGARANLELIHGDALDLVKDRVPGWGITKVVSNLPYSVGSRILMDLFALPDPPRFITVTVQLEVAERLKARVGHPERGLMGVWAQRWYDVKVVKTIHPTCFLPRPKVQSAIVQLTRHGNAPTADGAFFRALTRVAFGYRRKQFATILNRSARELGLDGEAAGAALRELGIDPQRRPETFDRETWERLAGRLAMGREQGTSTETTTV